MNKKLLLVTITVFLFLAGCGKVSTTNSADKKSPKTTTSLASVTTTDKIDFNQYIKKTWVTKKGAYNFASFSISKIENRKITGRFNSDMPAVPNPYDLGHLSGTINKDTAECQFSDEIGNKGNIKLVFKPNEKIEATIKLTNKSKFIEQIPKEGTFLFLPYNLNNMKEYSVIKDQSFMVDLNSWGIVKFVSAKLMGSDHASPVEFFLTNEVGDILFEFEPDLPYGLDVKAVSLKDVNKDGLNDIIIILADNYDGPEVPIATVYLQKDNGLFTNDSKLDQEINESGNNKDVKTVIKYLSQKF